MDQDTRNKLQRATQQVRRILEEEFAEQLEGTFDVLPDGKILPEPGKHLDARQRLTREKLVDAIEHIKAGGKIPKEAVDEYTREAAFTFLNRFVALRMLEARGMLQECVSNGDSSSGFKEFCGLAPGLSSLDDGGYRLYLESLFDELTVEVKVLFDRRDSASLLWPRRGGLNELLDILGQADLTGVWGEDETIGWVYQYFNSGEERKKMREESQAPRNSRELAVRNQFFTPRYVVEFLTDNTLGRIWYEMRKGDTRLVDECNYLVRRPSEVFVDLDDQPKDPATETDQDLSQGELLSKTVYIPHRPKKDPRDLRVLDPACGSGHFLLYAFDLLIAIYEEAWHDEESPTSGVTGQQLRQDYPDLMQLHAALPGLVLTHNLHGIDIDPRAAQIAALALWMRGQRAFNDFQIARNQRPAIARSNIVCAEPMPGEAEFLEEFIGAHLSTNAEGRFLANLVRKVFASMKLAGEAGSLLKIEEEIAEEVAKAKEHWLERPEFKQKTLFETNQKPVQQEFDLTSGITDVTFWEEAEQQIYDALSTYSERVERSGGYQRSLFATDAARGFGFIDLFRRRYDAVLMNPPFGECSATSRDYIRTEYEAAKSDLLCCFCSRFLGKLETKGLLGIISNRSVFFGKTLRNWRRSALFDGNKLQIFADLGIGVLDALVEAAAYCIEQGSSDEAPAWFVRALDHEDKKTAITKAIDDLDRETLAENAYVARLDSFHSVPDLRLAYWVSDRWRRLFARIDSFEANYGVVKDGLTSGDDFRFFRLHWEVPPNRIGPEQRWCRLAKGGEYAPYYADLHLVIDWRDGRTPILAHPKCVGRNRQYYMRPGLTYSERTTSSLSVRVFPEGCAFTTVGQTMFPDVPDDALVALGLWMSLPTQMLVEMCVGSGDTSRSGSAARHYRNGLLARIPMPRIGADESRRVVEATERMVLLHRRLSSTDETASSYVGPYLSDTNDKSFSELIENEYRAYEDAWLEIIECSTVVERVSRDAYELREEDIHQLESDMGIHPGFLRKDKQIGSIVLESYDETLESFIQSLVRKFGGSRSVTKKSYYADRRLELVSSIAACHPSIVVEARRASNKIPRDFVEDRACSSIAHFVGIVLGRWRETFLGDVDASSELSLFDVSSSSSPIYNGTHSPIDHGKELVGILVYDAGHPLDLGASVNAVGSRWCGDRWNTFIADALDAIDASQESIGEWLNKRYFAKHISTYSKSRRSGPIYWQLGTATGSYSVWIYYHRLTRDTFFRVNKDYLKPKLDHERQRLERLRTEAGSEPSRSQRKEIEDQEKFVAELTAMREEVERIAPLWNPDLNDGVIINFAPLWRLVPQNKSWQKECKKVWEKLVKGDYDWAHLAMHLWPERVVAKCVTDASLAIAHGLEDVFWEQDDRDRYQPKEKPQGGWEPTVKELVNDRTSPAVKAALESLLTAPAPAGSTKSRRRKAAK